MSYKILFMSVPPKFLTGYGVQTKLFVPELKRRGYDVTIAAVCSTLPPYMDGGTEILSSGPRATMGNDFINLHFIKQKADVILSLMDTFILDRSKVKKLPWLGWQVIDSTPLLHEIRDVANDMNRCLAMSRFGQATMLAEGIDSDYVPLAYDPAVFNVTGLIPERQRLKATFNVDWTDRFVIMVNAANMSNPSRKNFGCAMAAFKIIQKHIPEALLYIHTEVSGEMYNGENMIKMMDMYQIKEHEIWFPPQYEYMMGQLGDDYMRCVYNASDILLCTSCGEGFCVPLIEAQACGLPVCAPDFSATGELVFNGTVFHDDSYIRWNRHANSQQIILDPEAVAEQIVYDYEQGKLKHRYDKRIEEFTIANVVDQYLIPVLEDAKINEGMIERKVRYEAESSIA